jgi:hypothetical protein
MTETLFVILVTTILGPTRIAFYAIEKAQAFLKGLNLDVPITPYDGHYIDIYLPIAGHKAIEYGRDPDCNNWYVPWETGMRGWETRKQAYAEAIDWAYSNELPIRHHDQLIRRYLIGSCDDCSIQGSVACTIGACPTPEILAQVEQEKGV